IVFSSSLPTARLASTHAQSHRRKGCRAASARGKPAVRCERTGVVEMLDGLAESSVRCRSVVRSLPQAGWTSFGAFQHENDAEQQQLMQVIGMVATSESEGNRRF